MENRRRECQNRLFYRMVGVEFLEADFEVGELVALNKSNAGADALFVAAGDVESDGADAVADELVEEVDAFEAGIAEGEVETVADIFAHIFIVDDEEAVVGEEFLHYACLFAIFFDVFNKVEGAVVGAFEHGSHSVLNAVGGTRAEAVEGAEDERATQLGLAVVASQIGALHVEESGAANHHGYTFAGIAEALGAGNHEDIAVGVFSHSGLEGGFAGNAVVLAEVHEEVGVVFEDNDTVFVGHLADDAEFVVGEAEPCGVVGRAVDEACHIAVAEFLFEFVAQFVTAVFIDVEGLHGDAENAALLFLYGEARVDEEDFGLLGVVAGEGEEAGEAGLHGTYCWHAAFGSDVDVEEVLDKASSLFLEVGGAVDFGIDGGDTVAESLDLSLDANLRSGKSRDAHLHLHEAHFGLFLNVLYHFAHLTDAGFAGVAYFVLCGDTVDHLFVYWYLSHNYIFESFKGCKYIGLLVCFVI